jgi:peroxiredoxin
MIAPRPPAPAFSLADADGRRVGLADFRGRPLLVVFLRHVY